MSESRPRLLYLTEDFPYPWSTGCQRDHHLLRELASSHRVHLLSLVGSEFDLAHHEALAGLVDEVSTFERGRPRSLRPRHAHRRDRRRSDGAEIALRQAVAAALDGGGVDLVLSSGPAAAAAAAAITGRVPLVVDLRDGPSLRRAGLRPRPGWRVAPPGRRRTVRRVDDLVVRSADQLLVASRRDVVALREAGAPRRADAAVIVPNGVDLAYWSRRSSRLGRAVVFSGDLADGPTAHAARRLVRQVMPAVWAERPETPVLILGPGASLGLLADLAEPRVAHVDPTPDPRPHLERGAVFVAPVRSAPVRRNDLLEALAMELPVVTTSAAAAELRAGDVGPLVVVADTDAALARATLLALRTVQGRRGLPLVEGRRWVDDRFGWARSGRTLRTALFDAAGQPAAVRT